MRWGPFYMVLSTLAFTAMIAFVKVARAEMDALEVMTWRGLVAIPFAWAMARRHSLRLARPWLFGLRCVLGFGAMMCSFFAAKGLPVADLSLIWRLQPIFVAIIAPLALGVSERSSVKVVAVLIAGLAGCAILLAPGLELESSWGLVALAGAALVGGAHVCVRSLGATDPPSVLAFWFQVFIFVAAATGSGTTTGSPFPIPPPHLLPYLIAAGVMAALGQLLMAMAYSVEKASTVAAATYVGPLFAVAIDFLAFGHLPTAEVLIGGSIIVGASAVLLFDKPPSTSEPTPK